MRNSSSCRPLRPVTASSGTDRTVRRGEDSWPSDASASHAPHPVGDALRRLDRSVIGWFARNGLRILRVGLGVVFLWFGVLKFFPGMSPAEALIEETVRWAVDPALFKPLLAVWECAIGIGLILRRCCRLTLLALFAHMAGTFMPLFTCPHAVWSEFPHALTLEGQYILKNIVLIGAAIVLFGSLQAETPAEAAGERWTGRTRRTMKPTWVPTRDATPPSP